MDALNNPLLIPFIIILIIVIYLSLYWLMRIAGRHTIEQLAKDAEQAKIKLGKR